MHDSQTQAEGALPQEPSRKLRTHRSVQPIVFFSASGLLLAFLVFGVFARDTAQATFPALLEVVGSQMGWLYVLAVNIFLGLCVWLALSKHARTRLGRDHDRPEFSRLSWLTMLFSAGMGIGLVFHGVAEPILHFAHPAEGAGRTVEAARQALPTTYLHWGVHAWSIYAVVALSIAFFSFRYGLPLTLRACLYPFLGDRIYGWPGHLVDILAVVCTLFGLAVSLGLGAMQIAAGLNFLFDTPKTALAHILIICVITVAATISLVTGMKKGIRRLSELNAVLATTLLLLVFFVGPSRDIIVAGVQSLGPYFGELLSRAFYLGSLSEQATDWSIAWTVTYWAWWIAWAPFVGLFMARVSRGRTVREFILGSLLVPTGMNIAWFAVFGGTALQLEVAGGHAIAEAVAHELPTAIFVMLAQLPGAQLLSMLAVVIVAIFFVTSSDSASLVVDTLTSGGHPNPPVWQRVYWAAAEGATAAVLIYAGTTSLTIEDGKAAATTLKALQAGVISMGLPFCVVLLGMCAALLVGLRREALGLGIGPGVRGKKRKVRKRRPGLGVPMQLRRILVPINYDAASNKAVDHALSLAELHAPPGEVHVLHVAPEPAEYLPLEHLIREEKRSVDEVIDAYIREGEQRLRAFLAERPSIAERVRGRVERGVPWKLIVETAKDGNFDLIVLGSESGPEAEDSPLGVVAQHVVGHATCPAVIV